MKEEYINQLVSPVTHKKLLFYENCIMSEDKGEKYPIFHGIPIMLPENTVSEWQREIFEVLFWNQPVQLAQLDAIIDEAERKHDTEGLQRKMVDFIKEAIGGKEEIAKAMEAYGDSKTAVWNIRQREVIAPSAAEKFIRLSDEAVGSRRIAFVENAVNPGGWAKHIPFYTEEVYRDCPETIVEISTGMGFGTGAIAMKNKKSRIFTVDIDIACHGNAVGIEKALGKENTIFPVVANFWQMPFADRSTEVVCSHGGLEEARELPLVVSEIARILAEGGKFVCSSKTQAKDRQYKLFEPFGFTWKEVKTLLERCRLYSGVEKLVEICRQYGLTETQRRGFEKEITVTVFQK